MTAKSKWRGYDIQWEGDQWVFCDSGLPTFGSDRFIVCGECGLKRTPEDHDGCLGVLPEAVVMNACCGHGVVAEAYVQFWDGTGVYGKCALDLQKTLKGMQNESS